MAEDREIDGCILDMNDELAALIDCVDIKCTSQSNSLRMLLTVFSGIKDPRKSGMCTYRLENLLAMYIFVAIKCRKPHFYFVADYVKYHSEIFKRLNLIEGNQYPSHDTFRRLFMVIKPKEMRDFVTSNMSKFYSKIEKYILPSERAAIFKMCSVDGQEEKGTGISRNSKNPARNFNLVNLYLNTYSYSKDTVLVSEKTNEIPVAQAMLKKYDLSMTITTLDSLHCQVETAKTINARHGLYVLKVKSNQPELRKKLEKMFGNGKEDVFRKTYGDRDYEIIFLKEHEIAPEWPGARAAIRMVSHKRDKVDKYNTNKQTNVHYFISSLDDPNPIMRAIDRRWEIEDGFHRFKDDKLNQDSLRTRDKNVAQNINILNGLIFSIFKLAGIILRKTPREIEMIYSEKPIVLIGFICQYFVGKNLTTLLNNISRRKTSKTD